ncbi:hypothetical protein Egran_00493, partial [Elaphomyces granulatus]
MPNCQTRHAVYGAKQHALQLSGTLQPLSKGLKEISYHWKPSAYWDKLSKVWLTKSSLSRFDRKNDLLVPRLSHAPYRREVTRNTKPRVTAMNNDSNKNTGPYDSNFEQFLIDGGVYPDCYKYPDSRRPQRSNNLNEVVAILSQPQPTLSSSTVSDDDFQEYREANTYASKEDAVKASVITMFLRAIGSSDTAQKNVRFNNLASPANSIKEEDLKKAKPDYYYGSPPEQANANVRKKLSRHIVPSSSTDLPIAPNFFIEVKGPSGSAIVGRRQAWYDGVIGARAMHCLRSYKRELVYDNSVYTLSALYHSGMGTLEIYGHSVAGPNGPRTRP